MAHLRLISLLLLAAALPATGQIDAARLAKAVVIIQGKTFDGGRSHGTGFLTIVSGQLVIATNQHVLRGNNSFTIRNAAGTSFRPRAILAAADRDVALLQIDAAEALPDALPLADDINNTVAKGDELLAPGNSQGGGVLLTTSGKLMAVGPDRIEVDNPIFQGNSGGPIIHRKSGRVIGIITHMERIVLDDWAKASLQDRRSAIKHPVRYFGARLDNLGKLDTVNWKRWSENESHLGKMKLDLLAVLSWLSGTPEWRDHRTLRDAYDRWRTLIIDGGPSGFKVSPRQIEAEAQRFSETLDGLLDKQHRQIQGSPLYYQQRHGNYGFEQLCQVRTLLQPVVKRLSNDIPTLKAITQFIR